MVIHVKDVETDDLVRRLAHSRGIGITEAIKEAVREAISSDNLRQAHDSDLEGRLKPLFARLDRLPRPSVKVDKDFFDQAWGEESR